MIINAIPQTVEGKQYSSLKQIADAYDLKPSRIYKRFQRGERGDNLIPLKLRKDYIASKTEPQMNFIVGSLKFKNASDACRHLKINFNKYRSRIRNDWSREEALELILRVKKKSLREKKKRQKNRKPLIAFSKEYKSYKELAETFGMKDYVLFQRVNKYGRSLEEAILMDGKNKTIKVGDIEFKSMADCARAFNIEPNTFYYLIKHYSVKQIIGIENRMTSKSIVYKGKWYPNQVALAEDYGITKNELYYRSYVCKLSFDESLSIASNSSIVKSIFGSKAKLYVAEIVSDSQTYDNDRKLYKVGVTQHNLSKRYSELPFDCKTVIYKDGELKSLRQIEKMIKNKFEENRISDFTASDFDGFTEIYQLSQIELNNLKFLVKFDMLSLNQSKEFNSSSL